MYKKFTPLSDLVLMRKVERENKSMSGIILSDEEGVNAGFIGEVLEIGPGKWNDGKRVPMAVQQYDIVYLANKYAAIQINDLEFIAKESDILGIVEL